MKKVRINKNPTRQFSGNFKGNPVTSPWYSGSNEGIQVNKKLKPVPEHRANVEAEKDETVMFPKTKAFGDFPSLYEVGGKRHINGGTNLSLPEDAFVFSDTKDMRIKDKKILAMFGKSVGKKGKKQFTPAEISKKYQINDFLKTLADPDSTKIERETAEQMIKNYQAKLGQLALVQESSKGFPDGIPAVAVPYLYTVGVDPNAILGVQQQNAQPMKMGKFGGGLNRSADFGSEKKPYPTVSSDDFAGSRRSYPIPTIKDAQDALRLAHLHGRQDVISEIYSKYPELKKKHGGNIEMVPYHNLSQEEYDRMYQEKYPRDTTISNVNIYQPRFDENGQAFPPESYIDAMSDKARLEHSRARNKQRLDKKLGGVLTKMPNGGPKKGDIIVEYSDDANTLDANIFNAQEANPGKTIFVKGKNGKYQIVKGKVYPRTKYTGTQKFGDYTKSYEQLHHLLSTDEKLQDVIYENYKKRINNPDKKLNTLSDSRKKQLSEIPKEKVIENFLKYQEHVYALNSSGVDLKDLKDKWDTGGKNSVYQNTMKDLGLDALSDDEIAMAQGAYYALYDATEDPQYKDLLSHIKLPQRGKADEPGKEGKMDFTISPIDDWFGNTTAGQMALSYGDYKLEDILEDEEKTKKYDEANYVEQGVVNPDWWQQDVNNLGVATGNYLGVKKYNPWLQTIDLQEPSPTFISPERALAANAEQANIAQNAIGAFAGPQALSSRQANIQGTASKNAADILSQTHNQNVGIANEFELAQKQIRNQEFGANAKNAQNFYDSTVIANQNYDNEKNQAEQVMLGAYNQGLTNAQMTAAQNAMYPHYQTDPTTGQVYFNRGSKPDPNMGDNNEDRLAYINRIKYMYPEMTYGDINTVLTGQNNNQNTIPGYGTGNVAVYPGMYGNQGKFGGSMKKVKIKRLPRN